MNVLSAGQMPERAVAARRAAGNGWSTASEVLVRRSQVPPEEDRAPARGARRLPDRLSQHRRGDPHRPLRGRSQGQADRALQAHRGAGRRHPQPAPEVAVASSKRSRSRPSTTSSAKERRELKSLLKSDELQWERIADEVKATRETLLQEDRARPPPHLLRRCARRSRSISSRRMIEKEPITVDPVREGLDPRLKGHMDDLVQARVQAGRRAEARRQGVRPPTSCCCSPPTARSSRSKPTSCPAAAATASRCG